MTGKVGVPGPGTPQGCEPTGAVQDACCFYGIHWDFGGWSKWERGSGPQSEAAAGCSTVPSQLLVCQVRHAASFLVSHELVVT